MRPENIPAYIQIGFAILTLICLALVLFGLKKSLNLTPWKEERKGNIFRWTAIFLIAFTGLVGVLSYQGIFYDFTMPPNLFFLLAFCLIVVLLITFSKTLTELLKYAPPAWLIYIQFFRVPVELLLWALFVENLIPEQMTFEGRNFDVIAGLTAPLVAWYCFGNGRYKRKIAILWNFLCLGLLLNIVSIAILSTPTPIRVFMNEPANTVVTLFPVIWLPAFLVPLAYSMHFFSLRQLLKVKR